MQLYITICNDMIYYVVLHNATKDKSLYTWLQTINLYLKKAEQPIEVLYEASSERNKLFPGNTFTKHCYRWEWIA